MKQRKKDHIKNFKWMTRIHEQNIHIYIWYTTTHQMDDRKITTNYEIQKWKKTTTKKRCIKISAPNQMKSSQLQVLGIYKNSILITLMYQ